MIKAILLLVVAISGCATVKAPSETCVNAGKYAFTMAMLREGGIPLSTVERSRAWCDRMLVALG